MPSSRDIVYGIYGAWRLARLDRGAMALFDSTAEGFWKSFFAAVIVAPGYVVLLSLDPGSGEWNAGWPRIVVVQVSAYTLGWTVYPLAVNQICNSIGKQARFIGYIVAFNWSQVIQVMLPVVLVAAAEVLPLGMGQLLNIVVFIVILGYQWFIARTALEVTPMGAVGFVVLDLVLGFVIRGFTFAMLR
ncbi:MAG: hypothetical protein ACE5KF_03780 [Kiloniellaceae bacterium]